MVKIKANSKFNKSQGGTRRLVDVTFGVAKRDCAGFGICRIEPKRVVNERAAGKCGVSAEIYPAQPNGVGLRIEAEDICSLTMESYFAFDYFIVEEDFIIPPSIWSRYGQDTRIPRGYYPIKRYDNYFEIVFSPDSNLLSTLN